MAERKKYNFENAAKILATKTLTDPVIPVKEGRMESILYL